MTLDGDRQKMRYSDNSDMMTWTEAKLKSLDSYLTDKKYAYCETNPCLYTVDGKTPSYNPGGKCLYVDGTQMSMSKYQLIHFIKNRKVIAIDKAKDLYFEKIKSLISKPVKKEKVDFEKLFETANETRKYPELIEAMKNCSNSYKDNSVEVNKIFDAIKSNYITKPSILCAVALKIQGEASDGLYLKILNAGKYKSYTVKGFDVSKDHSTLVELASCVTASINVVESHYKSCVLDTNEYISINGKIIVLENKKEVK